MATATKSAITANQILSETVKNGTVTFIFTDKNNKQHRVDITPNDEQFRPVWYDKSTHFELPKKGIRVTIDGDKPLSERKGHWQDTIFFEGIHGPGGLADQLGKMLDSSIGSAEKKQRPQLLDSLAHYYHDLHMVDYAGNPKPADAVPIVSGNSKTMSISFGQEKKFLKPKVEAKVTLQPLAKNGVVIAIEVSKNGKKTESEHSVFFKDKAALSQELGDILDKSIGKSHGLLKLRPNLVNEFTEVYEKLELSKKASL